MSSRWKLMAGAQRGRPLRSAFVLALLLAALAAALPTATSAEQASQPSSPEAARLDVGRNHSCAVVSDIGVRCWGFSREGQLGYGNRTTIGDDETPGTVGPLDLGPGLSAAAISAGDYHSCALPDDGSVRCWGFPAEGRLGYGNGRTIGDDEPAGAGGPVDLGANHTARAISAGGAHSCAVLDDRSVRCWGYAYHGELGYALLGTTGQQEDIGDNETPGSVGPVSLGGPAAQVTAGFIHTCVLLEDGSVRCFGSASVGQLGYASKEDIGDNETPDSAGPVALGAHDAVAISAGNAHTCALLDDGSVRCWGFGVGGRLGYGNTDTIGDDESPDSAGPVELGPGRTARAISAGDLHTCALLDDGSVRCWGSGAEGRLGYGNTENIGDNETPDAAGPVDLGPGRTAVAISAGGRHTCARLDDGSVRCWGYGANGRLGYCNERNVGDNESPGSVGPVDLGTPAGGAACPIPRPSGAPAGTPAQNGGGGAYPVDPAAAQAARLRGLRSCLAKVSRHARRELRRARRLSGARRTRAVRHARRHRRLLRRRCLKRWGRTPGRVTGLVARASSRTKIVLTFNAAGSDGQRPPPAHSYLVKQSRRPIRSKRGFRRALSLCKGSCRFQNVAGVGTKITLEVTALRPKTTYYYAVAARDNVSRRLGPRSRTVKARTR